MTLRDLTPKQIHDNVLRAERERKKWCERYLRPIEDADDRSIWNAAFNCGFKAGLEIPRKQD